MSSSPGGSFGSSEPPVQWYPREALDLYPVRLDIEAPSGIVLAGATGFFVRDAGAQLIRARHCVTGVHQETATVLGGYPAALLVHLRSMAEGSADVIGRIPLFDD